MPKASRSSRNASAIITFPGEDGAAAAALLLYQHPKAQVYRSSKNGIADRLGQLSQQSPGAVFICGLGIPEEKLDAVMEALEKLRKKKTAITWYCGMEYLDAFRPYLEKYCRCEFTGDGLPMPETLFALLYPKGTEEDLPNLIRFVGTKYASAEDIPHGYKSRWEEVDRSKRLVLAAIRRWFNFDDEAIYPHVIRVLAGVEAMTPQDEKLIRQFQHYGSTYFKGKSPTIRQIRRTITRCAGVDSSVLILGETGTGKEIIAKLIHEASPRSEQIFEAVNCANLQGDLLQDRLFGHARGAFSGAERERAGLFEVTNGGTLFLDEIGEMPLETQAQLLRVIQEGQFYRLGEERPRETDVRIIAATHRDLLELIEKGKFREDLFWRLVVIPIQLPPLRERTEDIYILARHILYNFCLRNNLPRVRLSKKQLQALMEHSWPGNVRELENVLERMVVLGEGEVSKLLIKREGGRGLSEEILPLEEATRRYVQMVYEQCEENISRTAEVLEVARNTVKQKLKA
jgi:DNA-binding NtrC family response regulator